MAQKWWKPPEALAEMTLAKKRKKNVHMIRVPGKHGQ